MLKSTDNLANLKCGSTRWEEIAHDVDTIFKNGFISGQNFMDIYTRAYDYCLSLSSKKSSMVVKNISLVKTTSKEISNEYKNPCYYLYDHFNEHLINNQIRKIREELFNCSDDKLIQMYIEKWTHFKAGAEILSSVYSYVTRVWCSDNMICTHKEYIQKIYNLALLSWSKHLYRPISIRLYEIVFKYIELDRNGIPVDYTDIKALFKNLFELGAGDCTKISSRLSGKSEDCDQMLLANDEYKTVIGEDFASKYATITSEFYSNVAKNYFSQPKYDYTSYSNLVLRLYTEEQKRCQYFFAKIEFDKVTSSMDQTLIINIYEKIINEFFVIMKQKRYQDLVNMYLLLKKTQISHTSFKNSFNEFLIVTIDEHLFRYKNEESVIKKEYCFEVVDRFIECYNHYFNVIVVFFGGSIELKTLLAHAFRNKLNSTKFEENPVEAIIAFFIHKELSEWHKLHPRETQLHKSLEEKFYDWILLVYLIDNKDAYLSYHEFYLAERILANRLISSLSERTLLNYLSLSLKVGKRLTEFTFAIDLRKSSYNFEPYYHLRYYLDESLDDNSLGCKSCKNPVSTNNTSFMISNVDIFSRMEQILDDYCLQQFITSDDSNSGRVLPIGLTFVALNSTIWPYHTESQMFKDYSQMKIPKIFCYIFENFSRCYTERYPSRIAHLFYSKSTVVLETGNKLFDKNYSIELTLPQACLLLQFNKKKYSRISIGELGSLMGLPPAVIHQTVLSLYEPGLINIDNIGVRLSRINRIILYDYDIISVNVSFTCANKNVNLVPDVDLPKQCSPLPTNRLMTDEYTKKHLVQSTIQMYLKKHQSINKSIVADFVISQVSSRFKPTNEFIQECCNDLIEKEYMKESENDPEKYVYMP